jgi:hypothetical protein
VESDRRGQALVEMTVADVCFAFGIQRKPEDPTFTDHAFAFTVYALPLPGGRGLYSIIPLSGLEAVA